MADHNQIVKEQLIHMLVGTVLFLILAGIAVGLDLAAAYLVTLNVSEFTHSALEKRSGSTNLYSLAKWMIGVSSWADDGLARSPT